MRQPRGLPRARLNMHTMKEGLMPKKKAGPAIKPEFRHPWDLCAPEAVRLQQRLAGKVVKKDRLQDVQRVAGVDVAYNERSGRQIAAAVVLAADSLDTVEIAIAEEGLRSAYVPGLFSFRELPTIIQALMRIRTAPDFIVCDGQGIAHPRRFGLASHLGLLMQIPAIGCSKSRLIGEAAEPGPKRGDHTWLVDGGEVIGCALRTQERIKPVYVSIGHLISLETAMQWILRLCPRYRLPEPLRRADQAARKAQSKA